MTLTIDCLCGWRFSVSLLSKMDAVEILARVEAHVDKRHRLRTGMDVAMTLVPRGEPDLSSVDPEHTEGS